jgi:ABC-type multidrug transport system ATPase subunit
LRVQQLAGIVAIEVIGLQRELKGGLKAVDGIGVALQEAALDPLMTGSELIELQATLHGIRRARSAHAPRSSSGTST